ncbi:MAG: tRNA pseudouridine(55) synthase TruB [Oscillospiraceae bacterium]|nr:tRNA pseudouridine(55) synthase TruB [Oscillospiraceae bacterium]
MNGIILIDKPQNFTSFDVVAVARRKFGTKKVGHGGTLDPMATGVLPVFVGCATKAVDLLPDSGKSYRAGFRLGLTSDTLDIWGELSEEKPVDIGKEALEAVLERFCGEIEQTPPMYSALKVGGKKLCDLARQGIEVERKARKITISRLDLLSFDGKNGVIEVDCSTGTYIRTLVDDIGKALGTGAVMTSLCRTRACGFSISECVSIEELRERPLDELKLLSVESVFRDYPVTTLDEVQTRMYLNGVRLDADRLAEKPPVDELLRVYGNGEFLGIAKVNGERELVSVKRFINE